MASAYFQFDQFSLYPEDRQLRCLSEPVELNARYFDALALLVHEQGKLVSRERFFAEVWDGIPVTDEALTQCIKTLRKQLGDDATRPRFIETVPKHGYRFIAEVRVQAETIAPVPVHSAPAQTPPADESATMPPSLWSPSLLSTTGAGSAGGAVAGVLGALLLGAGGLVQAQTAGIGTVSALLVVICLCTAIAVLGASGVSFALAAARRVSGASLASCLIGSALGGMLTGAAGQLIGSDAFNLLLGRTPGDITGAAEGFVVGASIGGGVWLAQRYAHTAARVLLLGAACGAGAGLLIILAGGELMAGSLHALVQSFPDSRLQLDNLGALLGEGEFGPWTRMLSGMIEGGLFAACVVLALWWQGGPVGNKSAGPRVKAL
jgi:DNA-binding winged helix-turn-helix (wHTH) protein